ncbi:hypothetical protein BT69DRAFT_1282107 [Atractiella rhizophila]|nr:hypothetical protein BT69DRAFT_1282107 [Atractiella rhizophila]
MEMKFDVVAFIHCLIDWFVSSVLWLLAGTAEPLAEAFVEHTDGAHQTQAFSDDADIAHSSATTSSNRLVELEGHTIAMRIIGSEIAAIERSFWLLTLCIICVLVVYLYILNRVVSRTASLRKQLDDMELKYGEIADAFHHQLDSVHSDIGDLIQVFRHLTVVVDDLEEDVHRRFPSSDALPSERPITPVEETPSSPALSPLSQCSTCCPEEEVATDLEDGWRSKEQSFDTASSDTPVDSRQRSSLFFSSRHLPQSKKGVIPKPIHIQTPRPRSVPVFQNPFEPRSPTSVSPPPPSLGARRTFGSAPASMGNQRMQAISPTLNRNDRISAPDPLEPLSDPSRLSESHFVTSMKRELVDAVRDVIAVEIEKLHAQMGKQSTLATPPNSEPQTARTTENTRLPTIPEEWEPARNFTPRTEELVSPARSFSKHLIGSKYSAFGGANSTGPRCAPVVEYLEEDEEDIWSEMKDASDKEDSLFSVTNGLS